MTGNDRWLFVYSDGKPSIFQANLNDGHSPARMRPYTYDAKPLPLPTHASVPYPPKNGDSTKRTGMATLDTVRGTELYFPLNVSLLPSDDWSNNVSKNEARHVAGRITGVNVLLEA